MDKFDDFIKEKANSEKESFSLPQSFEDKIESVLDTIESEKINKVEPWYKNRRIVPIAACFVFSCLVLFRLLYNEDGVKEDLKISNNMESAEDNSLVLYDEKSSSLSEGYSADRAVEQSGNITLNLSSDNNQIKELYGRDLLKEYAERDASEELGLDVQTFVLNKNENVQISFSQTPNSYKVNLAKGNVNEELNYDEIKFVEYPSENYTIKAPSEVGMYLLQIIGHWDGREVEYLIKVQVKK